MRSLVKLTHILTFNEVYKLTEITKKIFTVCTHIEIVSILVVWYLEKLSIMQGSNRKLLSITEPDSEISFAYKKKYVSLLGGFKQAAN